MSSIVFVVYLVRQKPLKPMKINVQTEENWGPNQLKFTQNQGHAILKQMNLLLTLCILNEMEREEMLEQYEDRYEAYKSRGKPLTKARQSHKPAVREEIAKNDVIEECGEKNEFNEILEGIEKLDLDDADDDLDDDDL